MSRDGVRPPFGPRHVALPLDQEDVGVDPARDLPAGKACTAAIAVGALAVGGLGQQPRHRSLSHSLRPGEKVGVVERAAAKRRAQGVDGPVLTDDLREGHEARER
jgi:hypothetical protein